MDNQDLKEKLEDHEIRLRSLERTIVQLGDKFFSLCDKLDNLIGLLKWVSTSLIGACITVLIFIVELHLKTF